MFLEIVTPEAILFSSEVTLVNKEFNSESVSIISAVSGFTISVSSYWQENNEKITAKVIQNFWAIKKRFFSFIINVFTN